ncbi:MAG: hypothetical protein J7598_18530 [Mitsuaria chitosanitabida]|uniref:hypothetical protein n=1 Tax=Roseateles chitosanitabidus TaxID=65048 RepID=UPI001B1356C8|nr:hypothetical protein [Roseateles chitosanitabidus]MBO9688601.1 hypothetical protein [Roseateles chitosanitabidus]
MSFFRAAAAVPLLITLAGGASAQAGASAAPSASLSAMDSTMPTGLAGVRHRLVSAPRLMLLPAADRLTTDAFTTALLRSAQSRRPEFQLALTTRIGATHLAVSPGSKGVRVRLTRAF